mmetsp:Transcript_41079/g.50002  ORF Transcript_41079/g.50002 Transcript_41079/m.50002 type:complete len:401 (+) Transcript_41079:59-1261(+)
MRLGWSQMNHWQHLTNFMTLVLCRTTSSFGLLSHRQPPSLFRIYKFCHRLLPTNHPKLGTKSISCVSSHNQYSSMPITTRSRSANASKNSNAAPEKNPVFDAENIVNGIVPSKSYRPVVAPPASSVFASVPRQTTTSSSESRVRKLPFRQNLDGKRHIPAAARALVMLSAKKERNDDGELVDALVSKKDDNDDKSSTASLPGTTPPRESPKKLKTETPPVETPPTTPPKNKSPKTRRRRRSKISPGSLSPPPDWESIYTLAQELRADRSAPVDSDGAAILPETDRGDVVYRFQVLIALMLSSQTKDAVVGETMRSLQRHGLDLETINDTSDEKLDELIWKVGFHNRKTQYIKRTCEILSKEYQGDIPPTADDMMKLPGVGPKMAYIIESVAFGRTSGIGK